MPSSFDSYFGVSFGGEVVQQDVEQPLVDMLGEDILFNGTTVVNAKGDYTTVAGEENYRRAILRRLITSPGTYRLRPTYGAGVGDYVKKGLTKSILDSLRQRISEQVQADRRTEAVLSVELTPTTYGGRPGLHIRVVAKAFGRIIRSLNYRFAKES